MAGVFAAHGLPSATLACSELHIKLDNKTAKGGLVFDG